MSTPPIKVSSVNSTSPGRPSTCPGSPRGGGAPLRSAPRARAKRWFIPPPPPAAAPRRAAPGPGRPFLACFRRFRPPPHCCLCASFQPRSSPNFFLCNSATHRQQRRRYRAQSARREGRCAAHKLGDHAVELVVDFRNLLRLLCRTARFLLRCELLPRGKRWVGCRALEVVVDELHGLVQEEQRRVLPVRNYHRLRAGVVVACLAASAEVWRLTMRLRTGA